MYINFLQSKLNMKVRGSLWCRRNSLSNAHFSLNSDIFLCTGSYPTERPAVEMTDIKGIPALSWYLPCQSVPSFPDVLYRSARRYIGPVMDGDFLCRLLAVYDSQTISWIRAWCICVVQSSLFDAQCQWCGTVRCPKGRRWRRLPSCLTFCSTVGTPKTCFRRSIPRPKIHFFFYFGRYLIGWSSLLHVSKVYGVPPNRPSAYRMWP